MLENLPVYISLFFGLTTLACLLLFIWVISNAHADNNRKTTAIITISLVIWLIWQAVLSLQNVYNTDTGSFPPKIMLIGILPAFLTIIILFSTLKGRRFIDSLPLKNLTYLNIIRIPVEIVLYWLYLYKAVPELMTFEGRNFDILAGITAPVVAYFGLTKAKWNPRVLLVWNFICLGLLINIVVNALLTARTPIQQFAFDQPNIAMEYFPFSWLPTFIVPVVLFGHVVSIRQLWKQRRAV